MYRRVPTFIFSSVVCFCLLTLFAAPSYAHKRCHKDEKSYNASSERFVTINADTYPAVVYDIVQKECEAQLAAKEAEFSSDSRNFAAHCLTIHEDCNDVEIVPEDGLPSCTVSTDCTPNPDDNTKLDCRIASESLTDAVGKCYRHFRNESVD